MLTMTAGSRTGKSLSSSSILAWDGSLTLPKFITPRLASRGNAYSLFAAFVAVQFQDSPLQGDLEETDRGKPFAERANILTNLTSLADALEDNDPDSPLHDFVSAARQGTNTEKNRRARFQWFHRALTSDHL
jgi:hypothetical protein